MTLPSLYIFKKTKIVFLFATFILTFTSIYSQETINGNIVHDNINREYIIYIPASYDSDIPVPLIFCFHGYSSNAFVNYNYTKFKNIADTAGFIVVHPQGTLLNGVTHWNVGGWTTGSTVDDVGFTNALLDTISRSYNINAEKVYSTGMSNGGYMSFLLACQLSERFAAIASVTGSMTPQIFDNCNASKPMPIMQIHGTSDGTVPYSGNPIWTKSIDEIIQYWSNHNNCNPEPSYTSIPDINENDGSTVEHIVYENGDNCVTTEHFKVYGGDHDWPGAFGNMDIDASNEIWKFFAKYDINGLIGCETTLNKNEQNDKIKIYPNPVKDFLTIENNSTKTVEYQIFSILGQLILKGKIDANNDRIELSTLQPSVYFLKTKNQIIKFVKN